MKKTRYTEEQIIGAIKEHEGGAKVDTLCRKLGISSDTFYNWRSKYAGLEINETKRLRFLEQLCEAKGKPHKIICDNGTEFTSKAMFFWSKEAMV